MFVGHYGVSFVAKRAAVTIPLWVLFLAVQLLDVLWAPLVLLGVEKVRIVPGFTATNPLDLYYMPYTHSLVAASLWSIAVGFAYRRIAHPAGAWAGMTVALAVFSHWLLDLIVHKPDLPLYDNALKVGLGLWDRPALALGLEAILLFGGVWMFLKLRSTRPVPVIVLGLVMLAVQVYVFFGPPPPSPAAAASTALLGYAAFAALIWWLVDRRR